MSKKKTVFTGAAAAIITPFKDGKIDFDAYGKYIDWLIDNNIDAIVSVGTTGEGSTLTDAEHKEAIKYCVSKVNGRVPVIAGTGANDTAYSIELSKYACNVGADAVLLVTPYYNKATQNGLYESFKAIANSIDIPCILYNVPSRTGCNLLPETVLRLAEIDNIVGIKEASGNISQVAEIAALCGDKIDIYSGNDDQNLAIFALGGKGAISVLADIMPNAVHQMYESFANGDIKTSRAIQLDTLPLIDALFCEVNPIPVKAACSAMGFCENTLRLPLTPISEEHKKTLLSLMQQNGIKI